MPEPPPPGHPNDDALASQPPSEAAGAAGAADAAGVVDPPGASEFADEADAGRGEIFLYAFGNVEGSIGNQLPEVIKRVFVVAMQINPVLIGVVLTLKFLWDAVTDPIMAQITDNSRSRFGRRRPYILFGGVTRALLLVAMVALMPRSERLVDNAAYEAQQQLTAFDQQTRKGYIQTVRGYEQLEAGTLGDDARRVLLRALPERIARAELGYSGLGPSIRKTVERLTEREAALAEAEAELAEIEAAEGGDARSTRAVRGRRDTIQKNVDELTDLLERLPEARGYAVASSRLGRLMLTRLTAGAGGVGGQAAADEARARLAEAREDVHAEAADTRAGQGTPTLDDFADRDLPGGLLPGALPAVADPLDGYDFSELGMAQISADDAFNAFGLRPFDLAAGIDEPIKARPPPKNLWEGTKAQFAAIAAFFAPENSEERGFLLYLTVLLLAFTTLTTINSVPYFAMGIELAPSYDGRTRVNAYRSILDKIATLVKPWLPVVCFSVYFATAIDGLFWIAVFFAAIGIPSTVVMCMFTRERVPAAAVKSAQRTGIFRSMTQIASTPEFFRVALMFVAMSMVTGIFGSFSFYLNVYWVANSALAGSVLAGWMGLIAGVASIISLPIVNVLCQKFQKHQVLAAAIIWMAAGTFSKWWLLTPENPYLQFWTAPVYAVGIVSVFTILPTMLADVTDVDELRHGSRREGMFGAVNALFLKAASALTPTLSGLLLVFIAGFQATEKYGQEASTILRMRVLDAWVPGVILLLLLLVLWKYPLDRERVAQIKRELVVKREQRARERQADDPQAS